MPGHHCCIEAERSEREFGERCPSSAGLGIGPEVGEDRRKAAAGAEVDHQERRRDGFAVSGYTRR